VTVGAGSWHGLMPEPMQFQRERRETEQPVPLVLPPDEMDDELFMTWFTFMARYYKESEN
jgi:hypothetical protein